MSLASRPIVVRQLSSKGQQGRALSSQRVVRPSVAAGALRVSCSASSSGPKSIPLFPLSLVALPGGSVPLHIFEARYRILFNTLLSGDSGLEEDLIDQESPYKGTKRFGMCLVTGPGQMATVGTVLEISQHERKPDGRMLIMSKGAERFKVTKILKEKPYIIAEIEDFHDAPDVPGEDEDNLVDFGNEVRQLFLDTLRLSTKSKNIPFEQPPEIKDMDAAALSFWLATVFREAPYEQQQILEMPTVRQRLNRERDILKETLNYLSATVALKAALSDIDTKKE